MGLIHFLYDNSSERNDISIIAFQKKILQLFHHLTRLFFPSSYLLSKHVFFVYFIKVEEALSQTNVTFGISAAIIPNFKGAQL